MFLPSWLPWMAPAACSVGVWSAPPVAVPCNVPVDVMWVEVSSRMLCCGGGLVSWKRIIMEISLPSFSLWVMSWSLLSMVVSWLIWSSPCMVDSTCLLMGEPCCGIMWMW